MTSSQTSSGDEQPRAIKKRRSSKENKVFCYCREPEGNRFMIGCDECNEWYHGDCVQITKIIGKDIDIYFCPTCQEKNNDLKIKYFENKNAIEGVDSNAPVTKRCTDCINCILKPDCGECFRCKEKSGRCIKIECLLHLETNYKKKESEKKHPRKQNREDLSDDEDYGEAFSPLPSTSRKAGGGGVAVSGVPSGRLTRGRKKGWKKEKSDKVSPKKGKDYYKQLRPGYDTTRRERLDDALEAYAQWNYQSPQQRNKYGPKAGPTQCLGRGCIKEARSGPTGSKYCSDECGMKVAKERILTYLPRGVENYWRIEPFTIRQAREDEVRKEQEIDVLSREKVDLDLWYSMIVDYINSLKLFKPDDREEEERGNDGDFMVSCNVCTVEYGNKVISKHLERCFARIEKQTTYGTNTKCIINPNNIFCDEYNKLGNSYCKRLRVICPEHYKGDIEAGLEICGWPNVWSHEGSSTMDQLFTSVEDIISQGMCGIARKECKRHCGWTTTILGLIDNRRLAYFTRVDELCEGKKNQKGGDAVLLMSNYTEYHQHPELIIEKYLAGAKQAGETVMATVL